MKKHLKSAYQNAKAIPLKVWAVSVLPGVFPAIAVYLIYKTLKQKDKK